MSIHDLKVAFIGVSHWHVPLYFPAMAKGQVQAVSDPDENIAKKLASQLNCKCYTDWQKLLDEVKPDFVFAFAPHNQMKALALNLIARKIPFAIEKPLGLNAGEAAEVLKAVEDATIPFVWRYSDTVARLKESILKTKILHMQYRFIAGPPSRYLESSKWMLSSATAGGGCMTNLGVHFIDMALYLADSPSAKVLSSVYQYNKDYDIEIYASSLLKMDTGASLAIETGYAYPMDSENKRENHWCIVTEDGYYTLANNCLEAREFGKDAVNIPLNTDSDVYYPKFAEATLDDCINGRRPRASAVEMLVVRKILDGMNEAAKC